MINKILSCFYDNQTKASFHYGSVFASKDCVLNCSRRYVYLKNVTKTRQFFSGYKTCSSFLNSPRAFLRNQGRKDNKEKIIMNNEITFSKFF